jgi:hypothetical protein
MDKPITTLLEGFAAEEIKPGPGQYKCAACGGVFDKGWSDEEAAAELAEKFAGHQQEDCDVVCDDCFKKMGF